MQKVLPNYTYLIISVASPLQIGIYKNNILIDTLESSQKNSEVLLKLLYEAMQSYRPSQIIYTRGPGSFMGTKLTYITLKTIEIVEGITCRGCSAFALNGGLPIKAVGNLYFFKQKETIITQKSENHIKSSFQLPKDLKTVPLDEVCVPEYSIPAV